MNEFEMINKIRRTQNLSDKKLICGIGDDAAVIDRSKFYELVATDMLVEDDHFRLNWFTPEEIGHKAIVANLSDIAAMGGRPKYGLVSLCLSENVDEEWVGRFYKGLGDFSSEFRIIGGDITHGEKVVVSITLIGEVQRRLCRFRSGAKIGDLICVTGSLGASSAGLEFLKSLKVKNKKEKVLYRKESLLQQFRDDQVQNNALYYCLSRHLRPRARLKEALLIAKYAHAMIDVSDGLGSEVRHICEESEVGARVFADKIPIDWRVKKLAYELGKDSLSFALSGGEDFELVFTMDKLKYETLSKELTSCQISVVGKIVNKREGIALIKDNKKVTMPKGFEHFSLNLGMSVR